MATNLKLGDRLAIMRDGVSKGLTPQEAMASYEINKDGGYNNWKNLFKQVTGINPDLDNTYDYEKFFKENPEAAKQLLEGKVSPDILQMYKTPQAIQKERQILRQSNVGSINDLMDYSKYEKIINDYMNRSVNVHAYGGSLNMFAPGGYAEPSTSLDKIQTKKASTFSSDFTSRKNRDSAPSNISISTEELENFIRTPIWNSEATKRDPNIPIEARDLIGGSMFVQIPYSFIRLQKGWENFNKDKDGYVIYYLPVNPEDNEKMSDGSTKYIHNLLKVKNHTPIYRAYQYFQKQQQELEDYNTNRVYDNLDDESLFERNFKLLNDVVVYGKKSDQSEDNQQEEELNIDLFKPTSTTEVVDVTIPEDYLNNTDVNSSILAPTSIINIAPKVPSTINVPDHFTVSSNSTPEDRERNGLIPNGSDRDVKEKYLNMGLPVGDELHAFNNKPYSTVGSPGGSSLSTGNGGAEIGNGNTNTSTSGGIKMPDIFNLYDNLNYDVEIPFEDFLGDYDADYQYLETQVPTYETPVLYDLPPQGYVDIPNWNVLLIQDPGGNSGFWNFLAQLLNYQLNSRSDINDELMSLLFKPKDYFADPYAGLHYTNTANFYDAYNNDPYTKILRESNGIPLYAQGGTINKFDGYGSSVIQTPWYDPWKGNPIGRQVAENNARQLQLFQLSLDEYAKRLNEYINASDNWEYRDIEGDYPIATNIWTKETRIPIYKIPGSAMLKAFPNYTWNNGLTFEPNINYYTIRNAKGLYALVPQGSYISELMDLSFERDKALHPTKIAAADMTALVANVPILYGIKHMAPEQPKELETPQQAEFRLDNRSNWERQLAQNMYNFNNWYANYLKQLQLENTIRDMMFRPVTLTNYIRATGDTANGDDSWLGSFFDPNKHGMWFGLEGRAFLLNHPLVAGLLDFGVDALGAKVAPKIPKIGKSFKTGIDNIRNKYFFVKNPDSYTRGIGMGTEGIEDAFKTGVFRGNPRGTELNAKQFTKAFEKNKANFRDIVEDTGIKGIESKFQSRTLTEEEFNALKQSAEKIKKKENISTNKNSNNISLLRINPDRLYAYDTYADYIADVNKTIAKVEEMPNRIASGEIKINPNQIGYKTEEGITLPTYQPIEERFSMNSDYVADGLPLSYWYGDGRNPITKGHSYARSNYGVRVNNPETYTPFFHYLHEHPSFLTTPKLIDPSVELFGKGPFGITLKLDKTTGKPLIGEDIKKLFKRLKGKRK